MTDRGHLLLELSMLSTGSDEAGWGIPAVRIPAVNNDVDDAVPDATKPTTARKYDGIQSTMCNKISTRKHSNTMAPRPPKSGVQLHK